MANEFFSRTPTSVGDGRVWTLSIWVKKARNAKNPGLGILFADSSGSGGGLHFSGAGAGGSSVNDDLVITNRNATSGTADYVVRTSQLFRDNGGWLHIVVKFNSTSSIAQDRVIFYVNGSQITRYNSGDTSYPSQNYKSTAFPFSFLVQHKFGFTNADGSNGGFFEGEMFDAFFIDGQALTPDVFGFYKQGKGYISAGSTQATDFRPGQWVPKTPRVIKTEINRRGGFGVNGFYLPMNDSKNFGADFHGDPNSIITLNEKLPQPRVGVATTASVGLGYTDALRTDPFAANLVLALPFVSGGLESGRGDYSHIIRNSGIAKTFIWNNGSVTPSIGNTGVYYGSGGNFPGGTVGISTSTDFKMDGSFTVESWFFTNNLNSTSGNHIVQYRNGQTGEDNWVLSQGSTGGASVRFLLRNDNGTNAADLDITNTGITTNQWYHFAGVYDHPNTRATVYLNGVAVGINTNVSWTRNNGSTLLIGSNDNVPTGSIGNRNINGYLQDLRIYKGVAKYTGGFDVPRPYTPVGIATWRAVPDTTANNFATLNPLANGNAANSGGVQITYTNGNNTGTWSAGNNNATFATVGFSTGKWYWEGRLRTVGGSFPFIGISSQVGISTALSTSNFGQSGTGPWLGNGTLSANDIVGVAVSFTSSGVGSTITFYLNGVETVNGTSNRNLFDGQTNTWIPGVSGVNGTVWDFNFGQNPTFSGNTTAGTFTDGNGKGLFKFQPPSGFLALCEDNLPTPAISDPGKYFKTVLWTGTGKDNGGTGTNGAKPIVGVGFTPDLIWTKNRDNVEGHWWWDSVRGFVPNGGLRSNLTDAETNTSGKQSYISGANADGFSITENSVGSNGGEVNFNGRTYVSWCWRAGAGTTSTNTNGSIPSVVSVNQDAGFSIVSYTGNGVSGATVGHGLGKKPSFFIIKNRSAAGFNWPVYHSVYGATRHTILNGTNASATFTGLFNDTEPTSNIFSIGNDGAVNTNGSNYIAYCWAEIEGFSKFGSWVSNANADGPFIYCGFKPALVICKTASGDVSNWVIADSSRSSVNDGSTSSLRANTTATEATSAGGFTIDFLSNGFKLRQSGALNSAGLTNIFAAWAESPFSTANSK